MSAQRVLILFNLKDNYWNELIPYPNFFLFGLMAAMRASLSLSDSLDLIWMHRVSLEPIRCD